MQNVNEAVMNKFFNIIEIRNNEYSSSYRKCGKKVGNLLQMKEKNYHSLIFRNTDATEIEENHLK